MVATRSGFSLIVVVPKACSILTGHVPESEPPEPSSPSPEPEPEPLLPQAARTSARSMATVTP